MQVFEDKRVYDDDDEELNMIASRPKRAQWRHRRVGPAYVKCGRRVKYLGRDLNAFFEQNRISPNDTA